MTKEQQRTWDYINLKRALGTRAIVDECIDLVGRDETTGAYRKDYQIVHMAFVLLRDKLKADKAKEESCPPTT